jgi:hypothetical protein
MRLLRVNRRPYIQIPFCPQKRVGDGSPTTHPPRTQPANLRSFVSTARAATMAIDWREIAAQMGVLNPDGSEKGCSTETGRRALEILIGEDNIGAAIDYFISLLRSPLRRWWRCSEVLRCLPATSRHEERRRSIQWSHCEQTRSGPPSSRQYLGCRASLLNRARTLSLRRISIQALTDSDYSSKVGLLSLKLLNCRVSFRELRFPIERSPLASHA